MHDHDLNTNKILMDRGRSLYEMVLVHRQWNAEHGGVYVPLTDDTKPNPYLVDPLREVTCTDGLELTKINPAYMTRQVGELLGHEGNVHFNITSLSPLRPANIADEWEIEALRSFEEGDKESFGLEQEEGHEGHYRYMAPFFTEESCLKCHAKQGYNVGDVRGGISISFNAEAIETATAQHKFNMVIVHGAALLLGFLFLSWFAGYSRKAERKLEDERARLQDLVEITNAIHWEMDLATKQFTYINPNVEQLLGYPVSDWKDFEFWKSILHPEDKEWAPDYCMEQTAKGENHILTYRIISADSTEVWIRDIVNVVTDSDGNPVKLRGLFIDDTELKTVESKLKLSLNEKTVLLKEVHHRVKNNMAVIMSLQSLQIGRVEDGVAKDVLSNNMQRIRSMALVHEMIYQSEDLASIDAAEYLNKMSLHISRIYNFPRTGLDIEVEFDRSCQDLDSLIPMGLIVNELLSNAMKHAFENYEEAHINISLKCTDGGQAELIIKDNGKGLPEDELIKDSASLGLRLVDALVDQIDGSLEIKRDKGTAFHIRFSSERKA